MAEEDSKVDPKLVIETKPVEVKQHKQVAKESTNYSKPKTIVIKKKN